MDVYSNVNISLSISDWTVPTAWINFKPKYCLMGNIYCTSGLHHLIREVGELWEDGQTKQAWGLKPDPPPLLQPFAKQLLFII